MNGAGRATAHDAGPDRPAPGALAVEGHSIDFVPLDERYGTPRRLFTIWFSINLSIVCAAVGTLAFDSGLGLALTIAALALGNAVGTVFMAAHSAQGPQLGIPQMIQSRAQFGVLGAGLPLVAVIATYTLYTAADGLLVEHTLAALVPMSNNTALILFGAVTLFIAYVGYELIHRLGVAVTVLSGLLFVAATLAYLHGDAGTDPAAPVQAARFTSAGFMLTVTQAAAWTLSFGPYVADYSRYLPANVRPSTTFWYTGLGCFLGATLIMAFGAYIASVNHALAQDPGTAIASVFDRARPLVQVLIVVGVLEGNVMNVYSAYMSTATIFSGFEGMRRIGRPLKFAVLALLTAAATGVAMAAQDDFQKYFADTLSAMIYLLVPWSAINLGDYYLVRRGRYVIEDLFRRDGIYGAVQWRTLGVYALGILIQAPFMSLSFYQGPFARSLGADLAWLPGLVVPGLLYVTLARRDRIEAAPARGPG